MILLSFLECVVGSAWIKKGRESVESLDRNVTFNNGVGDEEELSLSVAQVAGWS